VRKTNALVRSCLKILFFLFLGLFALEWGLSLSGKESLCQTQACLDASALLPFGKEWLYVLGGLWAGLCLVLIRRRERFAHTAFLTLFTIGAVSEGVLFGALLQAEIPCAICYGVAGGMLLMICLLTVANMRVGLMTGAAWGSAILATIVLAGGPTGNTPPPLIESAAIRLQPKQGLATKTNHLYLKFNCSHCDTLVKRMAKAESMEGIWYIHFPTSSLSREDAARIVFAQENREVGVKAILAAKSLSSSALPDLDDAQYQHLKDLSKKANATLVRFGIFGTPSVVLESPNAKVIVIGDQPIIKTLFSKSRQEG
jgi:hypothetical protein